MPAPQLAILLQHLRRLLVLPDSEPRGDAELLQAFLRHKDEAAFAFLLHRHGPLVWRLCRRLLGNEPPAAPSRS